MRAMMGLAGLAWLALLLAFQGEDAAPHPLTGVWEGTGSGDSELLPAGEFPFRLVLEGRSEDEAAAWLTLGEAAAERAEVEFDPDTGDLWFRALLMGITLDAELVVEGETVTGTVRGLGVTVDLDGRRSSRELPDLAARGVVPRETVPRETVPLAAMTVADWRTDLAFLADALAQRHPGAFEHLTRAEWTQAVAALDARLPELSMPTIVVELARLVARLGDAHTMLPLQGDPFGQLLPVRMTWFADGLFVTAVDAGRPEALGLRVVRLGTRAVDEALALVASTFASENPSWTRYRTPRFLVDGTILLTLGIVEDAAHLPLVLEEAPGETRAVAIDAPGSGEWVQAPDPRADRLPLWKQRTRETYWFTSLEDGAGVYWAYNSCAEDPARPIEGFVGEVLAALEAAPTRRLVIDLRNNTGGNSAVLSSQLPRLAGALGEEGVVWGLIGPATFSSGMLNAVELRRMGARLAGEPTGGKPGGWGEVKVFQLPRSGLAVQHSTRFFRLGEADSPSLEPDLRVPLESPDGLAGIDPVLEAVLSAD